MSEMEYSAADSIMISMPELNLRLLSPLKRADAFWTCTTRHVVRTVVIMILPIGKMDYTFRLFIGVPPIKVDFLSRGVIWAEPMTGGNCH